MLEICLFWGGKRRKSRICGDFWITVFHCNLVAAGASVEGSGPEQLVVEGFSCIVVTFMGYVWHWVVTEHMWIVHWVIGVFVAFHAAESVNARWKKGTNAFKKIIFDIWVIYGLGLHGSTFICNGLFHLNMNWGARTTSVIAFFVSRCGRGATTTCCSLRVESVDAGGLLGLTLGSSEGGVGWFWEELV